MVLDLLTPMRTSTWILVAVFLAAPRSDSTIYASNGRMRGPVRLLRTRRARFAQPGALRSRAGVTGAALVVAAAMSAFAGCSGGASVRSVAPRAAAPGELLSASAFDGITDRVERSRALFAEASRVMLSPRCLNCHPDGDSPTQSDRMLVHDPPVYRGAADNGVPGLECTSCHQEKNAELARIPGAPKWHLAPRVMAWVGKTPSSLCEQLKDPARNGRRSLAQVVEHAEHDAIVGWGWQPGAARTQPPGDQRAYGALMAAWVRDGAECPKEGSAQ